MKAEMRLAGLSASAMFLVITAVAYTATANALHTMLYALAGGGAMGFIGYQMGYIISHPRGRGKGKLNRHLSKAGPTHPGTTGSAAVPPGEETFLDEIPTDS